MSDLTELKAYFYVIGSTDYPRNWSPNDKFGFSDPASKIPEFDYSINDVYGAFQDPIPITRTSAHNIYPTATEPGEQEISQLVVEGYNNPGVQEHSGDPHSDNWEAAFKILEYIYRYQTTASQPASSSEFINKADQDLVENELWSVPKYRRNTINITMSQKMGGTRIKCVSFTVEFNNPVNFLVYMVADDFVEDYSSDKMSVYEFEDIDSDPLISDDEWDQRIIEAHMNIYNSGRYKRWDRLNVQFVDDDKSIIIKRFYVYSSFSKDYKLPLSKIKNAIRSYLLKKHGEDYVYLAKHYPEIFASDEVTIFPILRNYKTVNGQKHFLSPIDMETLRTELVTRNYVFDPSESTSENPYRPLECIYIGSNNDDSGVSPYKYPFIAIEGHIDSSSKPISDRFKDYVPYYSSFDHLNRSSFVNNDWKTFHYLLFLSAGLITDNNGDGTNDILPNDSRVDESAIPSEYSFTIHYNVDDSSIVEYVSFKMLSVLFKIVK